MGTNVPENKKEKNMTKKPQHIKHCGNCLHFIYYYKKNEQRDGRGEFLQLAHGHCCGLQPGARRDEEVCLQWAKKANMKKFDSL